MNELVEAIAKTALHHADPPMSWNQAQRLAKAIVFGLFTCGESRMPEYDESPMHRYKGLKTVRTWTYTDG